MKQPLLRAFLAFVIAATILSACSSSKSGHGPASAKTVFAAGIPDRPEKISYPPFEFHPPKVAPYRVPLQSGPVAYVVTDHELPLVNIAIYVRTGD
jgi:zinc protease